MCQRHGRSWDLRCTQLSAAACLRPGTWTPQRSLHGCKPQTLLRLIARIGATAFSI